MSVELSCSYSLSCSGCPLIEQPYAEQLEIKKKHLEKLIKIPNFEIKTFQKSGLRSRLDFTLQKNKRGLYQKNSKEIEDIELCLQLSPELQNFLTEFRKIPFPEITGSFRLRVSPQNQFGLWLDLANLDTHNLLTEEKTLRALMEICQQIEIGQRHKSLITKKTGQLGLGDPVFHAWTQTYWGKNVSELLSTVASFTQPSHISNRWITQTLSKWFEELKPQRVLEFGSGIGNLTFPALTYPETEVLSLELNPLAVKAQKLSLEKAGLLERVTLKTGDFRLKKTEVPELDVMLVNPARNGVGNLFDYSFEQGPRPSAVIYMSCYPESMALDIQKLEAYGYSNERLILIDQFPQTSHMEVLGMWRL